ncbi:ABC transporter transmembrane domain-containing protein [Fulvimarina sp. 2208YS6-2-32]|uniref:ABC transporter transmembrane domain-containing protein n=1 Tax=Fulvimarina uroteuthidis TaxID=3098149 RepID=A0ABU5HXY0_9HYPH|nr:ABC transporter transmembrane domain-containing protein [Fulvimarina sp. 2208YS6-2-32]MDY8108000.1 ABC transporter transmembrane domain-containing protein [Fulvimarina sp. 2208YS6-2-32]
MRQTKPADDKKRRNLRPLNRLVPYVRNHRGMVAGAVVFLTLAALTTLSLPLAVRRVIDEGFTGASTQFIDAYFAMLLALAALLAVSSACRYYFVISLGERVVADLRKDVFAHLTKLSPSFYDRSLSGEIVSRLTADTTQIKSVVGSTASIFLRNAILFIGALAMMIITSASLSLIVISAIPFIVLPLVAFGRGVRRRSREAQDTLADATAYASEAIGAMRTVQAFTSEGAVSNRYGSAVDRAFGAARASIKARSFLTAFAIFLIFASVVAVLWIGASRVALGTLSPGTLGQFLLYAVFAAGALGQLSEVWGELALAAGAAERLGELLAEEPQIEAPTSPVPLPLPAEGRIAFDRVTFAYPSRPDLATVDELSFDIAPGETVAIVGASGSGKSTIFGLIERFYDPTAGRIVVDGIDIAHADPAELRARIAFVPQDTMIFAASVIDNIAFGKPGAHENDIRAAAQSALATGFIQALEHQYETRLGERGVTLSGGQRQRIAIARAILRDAPILLLDEATSALDAESEVLVQQALDKLMVGRTTLVIAHRLATVLKADRILVLDGGRIVEEGTHQTLIEKGGIYARLARLQFEAGHISEAAE